ncbi:MAG TPA: site-2 protease family protein [Melioribacteraceae bacterium]|nr:site-2 protease family protein [Melioribacteraceae bacterium]
MQKIFKDYIIHLLLFIFTFITTVIAGVEWTTGKLAPYEFSFLIHGLPYAISLLSILGIHEFGHYFAAKMHKVKSTLPFFIPIPPIPGMLNFGTMGAVIKTKSGIRNNIQMFDIGVSGPIAGFIASVIILIYGFYALPDVEYLLNIHPDYFSPEYGNSGIQLEFGNNLMFTILNYIFSEPGKFMPPMSEIYHYPYLCTGWFGLFVTAMNLVPVGQLDGGHIIYSMFGGKKHETIAGITLSFLILLGVLGIIQSFVPLGINIGWSGWLFWALILFFIIKMKHPEVNDFKELDKKRIWVGYLSYIIFILSFTPNPFMITF